MTPPRVIHCVQNTKSLMWTLRDTALYLVFRISSKLTPLAYEKSRLQFCPLCIRMGDVCALKTSNISLLLLNAFSVHWQRKKFVPWEPHCCGTGLSWCSCYAPHSTTLSLSLWLVYLVLCQNILRFTVVCKSWSHIQHHFSVVSVLSTASTLHKLCNHASSYLLNLVSLSFQLNCLALVVCNQFNTLVKDTCAT